MEPVDVLVVGGGPAGCAAATLLARWGHTVTMITKPAAATHLLGESIPPSTGKLFDLLGVTARVDAANFVRATGNTVWWGSSVPRIERFARGQRGWQVTTAALEAILRQAAAQSGARIEFARADADIANTTPGTFVLDCSGRSGVFARARRLRSHDQPQRTIALAGLWRADAFDVAEPTHTLIESYEGGWAWSVPTSGTQRFVALMVDPRVSTLARDAAACDVYLAELGKTAQLGRILGKATLVDGPRGWDASMYGATRYVDEDLLLVGDAGSFIDPLSSAGVKKALASGWLAAVAVHTSLVKPQMRRTALEFYEAREREVYTAFRGMTERYWRDAAGAHAHPFWADRAVEPDTSGDDAAVASAFARIRSAPKLCVQANPQAKVEPRPAVSGSEIIMERRLVRADWVHGERFAYDVDLLTLVHLAPAYASVPEMFDAYNRRAAPVTLPDFLAGLATAVAHRWLQWCDT